MLRVLTGYHKGGVETVQISEKSGVCVSGVRVCMCACVCVCVSFHSWLYEEGQKAWMQWNGQGLSSVTSVY